MKFEPLKGKTHCTCCEKPYQNEKMEFIGIQEGLKPEDDLALFNCPCGGTIVGKNKTKVLRKAADKVS